MDSLHFCLRTLLITQMERLLTSSRTLTFQKNIYCFNESPFKTMKNVFYFILKVFLVLKILLYYIISRYYYIILSQDIIILLYYITYSIDFLVIQKKRLYQKDKVNLKIHDVTTGDIKIRILPNISRSRGNQKMKFDQVIEYNTRKIFLQKSYRKRGRETSSRPLFAFFKKALNQVKESDLQLSLNIIRQFTTWHTIKTNCIKLQTTDPEICSILIFYKRVWDQFLHNIL